MKIKTLKLFKSVIKKSPFSKMWVFDNSSVYGLIKEKTYTTCFVLFVLSLLILLEIFLFCNTLAKSIILSCSLIILLLFLGILLMMGICKPNEKPLKKIYLLFLSFSTTLMIICLIVRIEEIALKFSEKLNNEIVSLFFITILLNSCYYHFFSQIRIENYRIFLSVFHLLFLVFTVLLTIKIDVFYYVQNTIFEILSLSLLISSTKLSQFRANSQELKSEMRKTKTPHHNEWKAMVNEFPIGVVIISKEKKVLFSNKTVYEMFELQLNDTTMIEKTNKTIKSSEIHMTLLMKEPATAANQVNSEENHNRKVNFDELSTKIGLLEEVEEQKNDVDAVPVEQRSHTFSSSNELTIYSHNSILRRPQFFYHFNSVNLHNNNNSSSPNNSNPSLSLASSLRYVEKEQKIPKNHKESGFKRHASFRRFKTENLLKFNESNNNTTYVKTKIVKVKSKAKKLSLDQIIAGIMIKNSRSNIKKEEMLSALLEAQEVRTYSTQYKNFKKCEDNKKKYELKIQLISYKESECFLILIEDVSYRDSIAQLRENNEYKNKIMTTLSHEILTPLNGAIPALEDVVSSLEEDSPLKLSLSAPLKSLYLLQNVLGDAVDFALINSNQLYLNYEECNIFEFLKETVDMFSMQAELKNIEISFNFLEGRLPPKKIIADFQRIRQILVSIVGNSLKNTPAGFIEITVEVNPEISPHTRKERNAAKSPLFRKVFSKDSDTDKQEKITLKFSVEDSGFGIEATKCENIKNCLKENNPLEVCNNLNRDEGCGLGLAISHCLALILGPRNNHGLDIDSQLNYGTKTEFFIEFYVERKPYQEFVNALSTIRETKEMTRYTTAKKKGDGNPTQSRISLSKMGGITRALSNLDSNRSKISMKNSLLNRISHSLSWDFENSGNKPKKRDKLAWFSQDNSPVSLHFNRPAVIKEHETAGSMTVGRESVHLSQYQRNHQFNALDNEPIFRFERKRSPERNATNLSKSTFSHHFDDILSVNSCSCAEALIVDDDAFNLRSLELILSKFGKKCVKAYNGDEAIKIVEEKYRNGLCGERCKGFRIIFMDYHMPIKDGVETTKVLKRLMDVKEIPMIPIIACTAFGAKNLVEEWEKAGMTHFITKPITAKKTQAILDKWV